MPVAQGQDEEEEEEEAEDEALSGASLSSHSSSLIIETPEDAEFEHKIQKLMAAKLKLRHLQNLVAMVQVNTAFFFNLSKKVQSCKVKCVYMFDNYVGISLLVYVY